MLTENLIARIENGSAELKSYCIGGAGVGFIQVPKNHYVVITGFSFSHFIDTDLRVLNDNALFDELAANALHSLQFQSGKTRFIYSFRTNFQYQKIISSIPLDNNYMFQVLNDAEHIDTYQKHQSDINISIFKFHDVAKWVLTNDLNSNQSNSENLPSGYGNPTSGGQPSVQAIEFTPGGAQYIPLADVSLVPPNANYRKEFRDNVDATTRTLPVNQVIPASKIYTFPVINIDYVIIKND